MARRRPRVLAVGDAIVDVLVPPLPARRRGDAQHVVPRLRFVAGGNATNFVLQGAALGARTRFVGCVGRDPSARLLLDAYRSARVEVRLRTDARPTGATVALASADAGRVLVTAPGANAALRIRDVPTRFLEAADHVHRAGYWWTPGFQGTPTATLLARARRAGASTSLDVATDPAGWSARRVASVRACLRHVTTFFGNPPEVRAVGGHPDPLEAARRLCRLGAHEVVLHRGARGAVWVSRDDVVASPAFRVPAENPTGCGDVFNAAFVVARLHGEDVPTSLRFANACAALHLEDTSRPYPSTGEIDDFLRRRKR
ncbi:MAG: carbohydrate kinase family protein [Methanobacteriota archaeon]